MDQKTKHSNLPNLYLLIDIVITTCQHPYHAYYILSLLSKRSKAFLYDKIQYFIARAPVFERSQIFDSVNLEGQGGTEHERALSGVLRRINYIGCVREHFDKDLDPARLDRHIHLHQTSAIHATKMLDFRDWPDGRIFEAESNR